MALRSLITRLHSLSLHETRIKKTAETWIFLRGISSNSLPAFASIDNAFASVDKVLKKEDNVKYLRSRILLLEFPKRKATSVLDKWVKEGRKVSIYDLREISYQLVQLERYKHALEVMKWMEAQDRFHVSETDRALRLELTVKAGTLKEAEYYFRKLPNIASQKASYLHLLNLYVKEQATKKAESLMIKMNTLGANVTPHPFNLMMKLYIATSKFDLVLSIISRMKETKIPRNVLSYNLWMIASYELHGVTHVDTVYNEMVKDKNVRIGWSSLCTLANIYMKSGLVEKANLALQDAETKLSLYNHFGYFFLITNYAKLENKRGVIRVWEACKRVQRKLTCTNYMCIMSCFIKLGDVEEAEKIFVEWDSQCIRHDVRVSNILLGCYVRDNLMEKAEALHSQTLEKGGLPNYKTWEILLEGYVRNKDMEKAIFAMKNGFKLLKTVDWRPSHEIVEYVSECLEKSGNLEDGKWFLKVLRASKYADLSVYRCLIRMHVAKREPIFQIIKWMKKDKIVMDDETMSLVQSYQMGA